MSCIVQSYGLSGIDMSEPQVTPDTHRVKTALRIIEIIEIFAKEQKPLSLSELAKELKAPNSSCLALIRTLMSLGYLYETNRRQGYYPTGRLLAMALKINQADPILERVQPSLQELSRITGETTVIGKLTADNHVLYLDVVPSVNPIRYVAMAGELKEIHSNSIGKALFSAISEEEQETLLKQINLKKWNEKTITTAEDFIQHIQEEKALGRFLNRGESIPDVGAIAWPVHISGMLFAISIAGPLYRIEANMQEFAEKLRVICTFIEQGQ